MLLLVGLFLFSRIPMVYQHYLLVILSLLKPRTYLALTVLFSYSIAIYVNIVLAMGCFTILVLYGQLVR